MVSLQVKLLIIKPSSLGDIIHGLQVVQALQAKLAPGVVVHWVAREIFAGFVNQAQCVDRVFVFQRKGGVRGFSRLVSELRAQGRYDYVLDMQGLARSALLARSVHSNCVIGRPDAREGGRWIVRRHVAQPANSECHAIERLLPFAEEVAGEAVELAPLQFRPCTNVWPADRAAPILIFAESRRQEKEWHGFAELAGLLRTALPAHPLLWCGTGSDPLPAAAVAAGVEDWRNRIGLAELPALVQSSLLTLANDSGPMHLAAALGKPVLAVFGPTPPQRYGPYPLSAMTHRIVSAEKGDLSRLAPETVLDGVRELISRIGKCPG